MKNLVLLLALTVSSSSFASGFDLSRLNVIGKTGTGMNTLDDQTYDCKIVHEDGILTVLQPNAYYSRLGGIDSKDIEQVEEHGDNLVLATGKSGVKNNSFLCGKGLGKSQGEFTVAKISKKRVEITTSYRCLPSLSRESYTYTCDLK